MDFERELTKLGLWRKLMPRDGKCLLNAIVDRILVSEVDGHFDALMTRKEVELAGFCQAIVYELLYARVFGLRTDEVCRGRDALRLRLRGSSGSRGHNDSVRDTELIPFAYRAAKALDESIYRNVQFDNWRDEAIQSGLVKQLASNAILNFGSDTDNFAQLRMEQEISSTTTTNSQTTSSPSMLCTSEYDRAIRTGCLGLKQHVHWHAPRPGKHPGNSELLRNENTFQIPPRYALVPPVSQALEQSTTVAALLNVYETLLHFRLHNTTGTTYPLEPQAVETYVVSQNEDPKLAVQLVSSALSETISNDVPANWMHDSGPGAFQPHLELTNTTQFGQRCLPKRHYVSEALVPVDTVLQATQFPFHFVPSMPPPDAFAIDTLPLPYQPSALPMPPPDTAYRLVYVLFAWPPLTSV
ncbi:hypothetical protein CRM22_001877 [Opisthorchis felineus]|uniref:OTU domain-containing protein n=1 Tax=Opisthorchis felineus TaxID=147828 RepID=A0A4S2MF02_OPIFE|nr:hypothetical protein CRM22_001877 [Opisthorchis felineus]